MKRIQNQSLYIKIAVSLSLLASLAHQMDIHVFVDAVFHSQLKALLAALTFCLAQMFLLSLRWKMLINVGKKHLTLKNALEINLSSQLANLVFITSLGGLLARFALCVQHGVSITKIAIATLFDRLFTLLALLVLSIAFLPSFTTYVYNQPLSNLPLYICALSALAFLFTPLFVNAVVRRMPQKYRTKTKMRYGLRYLKVFTNNASFVGEVSLISVVAQTCFFVSVFMLCTQSDANISFPQLMAVLPVISLIAALPISIGGWGVREGAFIYGLGLLGVPMETAFAISVQVGLVGIASIVITGIPSLMSSNFNVFDISNWQKHYAKLRA